ncbi:sortase [Candidatus Saccharibacteria bacterium]|nr:sortase [Candidatus Saccharibacteria bacterium]
MKTGKNPKFIKSYAFTIIKVFVMSFIFGLLAGKLAVPVSPVSAANELKVEETTEVSTISEIEDVKKAELADFASANSGSASAYSYSSYASNNTASANSVNAYANSGLYIPSLNFYSGVSSASVSGNTVAVPASGVAQMGSLLVGHNPGTFSAILGIKNGDIFYLYGQAYQVYSVGVYNVSDNMKFVGQETTSSLSNGSKGLVLMTCYGSMRTFTNGTTSASQRFLVYARAV